MELHRLAYTLFPFLVILAAGLYLSKNHADKKWVQSLSKPNTLFWILIGWTFWGFVTNSDYTNQAGCMVQSEPIFSTPNMLFSGTALLLLAVGFFLPFRKIGIALLIVELVIWVYKLWWIKRGYAVGFAGVPSLGVLCFDIVALALRLMLIKQLLGFRFRALWVLIPVCVIVLLKIWFSSFNMLF